MGKMLGEKWQLRLNSHKVVGPVDDILYKFCHKEAIVAYWVSKGPIAGPGTPELDWESNKKAMIAFGLHKKNFSGG